MHRHFPPTQQGFSLVELSIVLVILGLLTGGILGGQTLIHAAELRAVGDEHQKWHTAVYTFRGKYLAYPGDIKNATRFWGAVNLGGGDNCSDPINDQGTGTQTCNGDGDGRILQHNELHRFWQHLANAGLIAGEFTGVPGPASGEHSVFDENSPRSKFGNTGWSVYNRGEDPGNAYFFTHNYGGNIFYIGAQHFVSGAIDPGFSPVDAWNIDTKFDDGMPNRGNVIAHWWEPCTLADAQTDTDKGYDLERGDTISCSLIFKKAL